VSSFHDHAPPVLYTLSLHDALPILSATAVGNEGAPYEYLIITLTDVKVVGYEINSNENSNVPAEEISLIFESITYRYVTESGERSEEHTSELQSRENLVCRLLLEKK